MTNLTFLKQNLRIRTQGGTKPTTKICREQTKESLTRTVTDECPPPAPPAPGPV